MSSMITAVVAFFIDAMIGDPRSKWHPVVLIGNLISLLEKFLLRGSDSPIKKAFKGGVLVYAVVIIALIVGFGIEILSEKMPNPAAQIFIQALALSFMISPRSLGDKSSSKKLSTARADKISPD